MTMNMNVIKEIEKAYMKTEVPSFGIGDTIRVAFKIKEGDKERLQSFEGIVMKRQNGGVRETATIRKIVDGVGVERTFPIHSPRVDSIKVVKRGKVRRAKLYYMRGRTGGSATRIEEAAEQ